MSEDDHVSHRRGAHSGAARSAPCALQDARSAARQHAARRQPSRGAGISDRDRRGRRGARVVSGAHRKSGAAMTGRVLMRGWWAAVAGLALMAANAHAQSYPAKPIRMMVPFPAGGGSDTIGRVIGQKLAERLGQSIVVENPPVPASIGADSWRSPRPTAIRSCSARPRSSCSIPTSIRKSPTTRCAISRRSRWSAPCRWC